jgi:hypothetical protein
VVPAGADLAAAGELGDRLGNAVDVDAWAAKSVSCQVRSSTARSDTNTSSREVRSG